MSRNVLTIALICLFVVFFPAKPISAVSPVSRGSGSCVYNVKKGLFEPVGCPPKRKKLPECSVCNSAATCNTPLCVGNRCIYKSRASERKCFGPDKLPGCAECSNARQCESGKCDKGVCMDRNGRSASDCARKGKAADLSSEVL